ncbi:hypothetical protein PLEOSDRAFT_1109047 [Pleurotus ostreatus PC15]|uniref:Uncharacterized protein n=1 Tax=Pleurotus ostreatus (strain PC15) TaxID=1137138 RepID=A0A067N6F2_PLEO1|nr:hypothetical protein PLEOSDRAFT_1109047 [Pleurotus ostreatus PC15]
MASLFTVMLAGAISPLELLELPLGSPSMYSVLVLLSALAASTVARPANDWSKPCFDGECAYDLPATTGATSGVLGITGAPHAITDITPAAGWVILDCDPNILEQDIRLVCSSDDDTEAGCNHLFHGHGPVNKIVRLPESCAGANPFARISRAWIPEDQRLPQAAKGQVYRRDGATPQVHALSIDTNWAQIDSTNTGEISFAFLTTNNPVPRNTYFETSLLQRRDVSNFAEAAIANYVDSPEVADKDFNFHNTSKIVAKLLEPKEIFKKELECNKVKLYVKAEVDFDFDGQGTLTVSGSGQLTPKPSFSSFQGLISIKGKFAGSVDITGGLEISSSPSECLTPGHSIVDVGPRVSLLASFGAKVGLVIGAKLEINYDIQKAELVWPPSNSKKSIAEFRSGNNEVKLTANPNVAAVKGSIEVHVIPKISFGISAFSDKTSHAVFFRMDGKGELTLTLGAASATLSNKEKLTKEAFVGCAKLTGELKAELGAETKFFSLWDKSTKATVWKKEYEIWEACYPKKKKRSTSRLEYRAAMIQDDDTLKCPSVLTQMSKGLEIFSDFVKGSSVKEV